MTRPGTGAAWLAGAAGALVALTGLTGYVAHRLTTDLFERLRPLLWLSRAVRGTGNESPDYFQHRVDLFVLRFAVVLLASILLGWASLNVRRLVSWFRSYLAEEGSPIDLAVFRMVVFATIFLSADPSVIDRYARLPEELLTPPLGFAAILREFPPDPAFAHGATLALRAACLLAIAGAFSQASAFTATLLAIYVLGIPQCFGKVNHSHFLIWFALILAFSRCGDSLSVDAAVRARRRHGPAPAPSVAYGRPLRWVWLLLGTVYFFPGFWKLWLAGTDWLFGDALVAHMKVKWLALGSVPSLRIDRLGWLTNVAALGVIGFELSFLFLILRRRTRPWAATFGLVFHNSTRVFMRIGFFPLQAMYVSFLPIGRFATRRIGRPRVVTRDPEPLRADPTISGSPWRALDGVAGFLLVANVVMGMLSLEAGWPLACFPTFAFTSRGYSTGLEFVAVSDAGASRRIDVAPLVREFGVGRWHAIENHVAGSKAGAAALARLVASRTLQGAPARRIEVYRVRWNTAPDRLSDEPIFRAPLVEVQWTPGGQ